MDAKLDSKQEIGETSLFRIHYGYPPFNFLDVTYVAIQQWMSRETGVLQIPQGDEARAIVLSDPFPGVLKLVRVTHEDGTTLDIHDKQECSIQTPRNHAYARAVTRLKNIHRSLRLKHGSFSQKFPEQCLSACFIAPQSKVLELGANIGRNTLVIAALLDDCTNLVTLECAQDSFKHLLENRAANSRIFKQKKFHAENAALSTIPLMQRGWNTYPRSLDKMPLGFVDIKTITFSELEKKYNTTFDTLVADAEGALFHILQQDAPNVLKNLKTIILENDFHDISHKQYVDIVFAQFDFHRIYAQPGGFGPCYNFFYETWIKSK